MLKPDAAEAEFLSWLESEGYAAALIMPDAMWCGVKPLLFHWTLHIGEVGDRTGYLDRYCYADFRRALLALIEWSERDFQGEPSGWRKHPASERRRNNDGDPASEVCEAVRARGHA
ncbi:hypothetical protein MARCHEWKA_02620 [Brevundimonas phage vB_BpoS-Marchewka]|uniref:Uncharacterized protein n=1 Tax=Brevundimonas phage vB_BpoS-Marchewka TaxID=2948604 RepID=A0A9E7SR54_9CAUD|nr:hypothetical protein MARCHEWKA_02620 [Brevundimonas phage vB_BpoS-Marchewka]